MAFPLRQLSVAPAGGAVEAPVRPAADSYRRLADVFHQILSEQELDTLLEQVAEALADLVPYDTISIYEADEVARELVPVYARDRWHAEILGSRNRFGEGITGWAVQEQTPVLTNEAHRDPRRKTVPGTPADEAEALVCIPLIARGVVKGALNVYRLGEDACFGEEEFELAQRFGDAVALAFDNAQTRARLQLQAQTDSLTGLFNHRYFHDRLRAELGRANRSHEPLSVAMVDIDEFKRVNDVHGHGAGDEVLTALADLLRGELRGSDVVCRVGGEEFAVIMPGCSAEVAVAALARLHTRLAAEPLGAAGSIGLSVGIASAPQHGMNPRELVTCAEAAMMTVKARSGGASLVFSETDVERPDGTDVRERDIRSIAHLKMLQRLGGKLNRLNELKEIGAAVTDELRKLIDYHNCRVYVLEGEGLRPIGFRGDGCEDCRRGLERLSCKVGQGVTGTAAKEGRTLLVGNARNCEFAQVVPGTDPVDESLLAVPLRYGTRVIGVVVVSKLGVDQFPEDDVRMLEVLAGHASVAIENARLYDRAKEEARRANEQLEVANALLRFGQALAGASEPDEVVRLVIGLSVELLDAQRGSVWLQDEPQGDLRPAALCGYRTSDERRLRETRIAAESAERLLGDRDPFVATAEELAELEGAPKSLTSASFAIAPFRLDERRGCLVVNTPDGEEQLDEQKLRLLEGLSHQARLAIANASSFARLRRTLFSAVEALANAAEANDQQTSSHAREITEVAVEVGAEMGLDAAALRNLELGALFHDIGKIGVPTTILRKEGPLTGSERSVIETHPEWGERILSPIEDFAAVRPIVRHSHERFDGAGYPDGKAGEEIPIESRIVLVCDAFHAMTTDRPYRRALTPEEAERRLVAGADTQFDPAVVEAFLRLRRGS